MALQLETAIRDENVRARVEEVEEAEEVAEAEEAEMAEMALWADEEAVMVMVANGVERAAENKIAAQALKAAKEAERLKIQ